MLDDGLWVPAAPACLFCGEPESVELFEIWDGHEFMIQTCCESLHEQVVQGMADDPAWGRSLLSRLGAEEIMGRPLRRLADDGGCGLLLDWQLQLQTVTFSAARAFVGRHHSHCGKPTAWRFGQALLNGRTVVGVAMVGNPVSPALNGRGILEVNRLCIRRDLPRALAWNAASMLYGWCAREAERQGWRRIVTYTRIDEDGTSLRAAGWEQEAKVRGRGWHSSQRSRSNTNAWINKVRWGKHLKPRRPLPRKEKSNASTRDDDGRLDRDLFDHGASGHHQLGL